MGVTVQHGENGLRVGILLTSFLEIGHQYFNIMTGKDPSTNSWDKMLISLFVFEIYIKLN